MTQLTLDLSDDMARRAEAYARAQGKSLSSLVEEYLQQFLPAYFAASLPELPPELARLRGAVQLPPGTDYKQALTDAHLAPSGASLAQRNS
jgi:Family of unknown function (DUF6364)